MAPRWNPYQVEKKKPFSHLMCTFLMCLGSEVHLEPVSLKSGSPLLPVIDEWEEGSKTGRWSRADGETERQTQNWNDRKVWSGQPTGGRHQVSCFGLWVILSQKGTLSLKTICCDSLRRSSCPTHKKDIWHPSMDLLTKWHKVKLYWDWLTTSFPLTAGNPLAF